MMKSPGKPSTPRSASMSVVFYIFIFASVFLTFQGARIACKENPLTEFLNSAGVLPDIHFSTTRSSVSSVSTSLAYNQSFGFFDDIRDGDWKIAQRIHAKTFPNTFRGKPEKYSNGINDKGKIEKLRSSAHWYAENFQEEFHCAYSQRVPSDSNGDGPKWICDPHRIGKQKDCLIYSVGSNGNTMFEEGVKSEIGSHCEIHTFDMVTYNKRNGHFQPKLEAIGAHFHAWGLGTQAEADAYEKTKRGAPIYTLQQTMAKLNHTGRVVDVFKIDCEWCEWYTYEEWLQAGDLRQILVETHNAPMPNAMDFFYTLHDAGYVIFNKEANYQNLAGGVEYGFLKLHTDFYVQDSMYSKLLSNKK